MNGGGGGGFCACVRAGGRACACVRACAFVGVCVRARACVPPIRSTSGESVAPAAAASTSVHHSLNRQLRQHLHIGVPIHTHTCVNDGTLRVTDFGPAHNLDSRARNFAILLVVVES